jgi:transcriptional regulator
MDPMKPIRNLGNDMNQGRTVIEMTGAGPTILEMRRQGHTQEQIADTLGLNIKQVNMFLQRHENLPEKARTPVNERTVFNIGHHLEIQFERLVTLLEELRHSGKAELELQGMSELRQYLNFAASLTEKLVMMQQQERLQEAILDEIEDELPGIKMRIYRRLAEKRDMFSMMRPM